MSDVLILGTDTDAGKTALALLWLAALAEDFPAERDEILLRLRPKAARDLTVGRSCGAAGPESMWRTVSFLAAQASLTT